jgi:MSHA biogenesis protein MshI
MSFGRVFGKKRRANQFPVNLASLPGCAVAVQLVAASATAKPQLGLVRYLASTAGATERLDHMARDLRIKRARLNILLEGPDYQFLQIDPPSVPVDELKTAVRWLVKDVLRHPLDAVTLDVLPPPEGQAGRRPSAYVVASPNSLVRERMLQFRAYTSDVEVIDVPEMAQRNLADRLEEHGRATAVLSITSSGCLLTASRDGALYFTRNFELSTLSLAAAPSARRDQFDRLVLELQRSLDVLDHQFSFLSVSTLWIAPFAQCEELLSLLIENLYLPVKIINLAEIFDCSRCQLPEDANQQASLFHTLGMALRNAEDEV